MDPDQHLESWFQVSQLEELSLRLKSPVLVDVARSLYDNVSRIHTGLLMALPNFVGIAARLQGCYSTAIHEITGKSVLTDEEHTNELESKFASRMMELVRLAQDEDKGNENRPFYESTRSIWDLIMHLYLCEENRKGLLAIRESIVINIWSCIEIALESVWDGTLASVPRVHSRLGVANRISSLSAVLCGYSIPKVRSNSGKEKLKSIQVIREAYSRGFDVDSANIDNALAAKELEALSLVRNLLVHKRGIVDQEFKDRAPYFPELKKSYSASEPALALPGPLVGAIVSGGLTALTAVIESVDDWIEAHP